MPSLIKMSAQTTRKPALGRGLDALIPQSRPPGANSGVTKIPIDQIHPDRANPRKDFDEAALEELAVSLRNQGVLQPVLVRRDGRGYRLIAGERRWRAAQKAGLLELPATVREATDAEAYEMALVENIQRADLNPLEEGEAFRRLIEDRKLTQEQAADRVGKDRSTVANALRLLSLPNEVKQLLIERDLSMGHARAILGLSKAAEMVALAREVITESLSVRETESRVKQTKGSVVSKKKRAQVRATRRFGHPLPRRRATSPRVTPAEWLAGSSCSES